MKLFAFAIASVVDANTGYGLVHDDNRSVTHHSSHYSNKAHKIRSRSVLTLIGKVAGFVKDGIDALKARAKSRREVASILNLNSHMLKDIGLDYGDLKELKSGRVSLDDLNLRRSADHRVAKVDLKPAIISAVKANRSNCANQETFELARCG